MEEKEELKASIGLKIICFLIPLVGLIIYACNVSHNKKYANQCGISSLIGVITPIVISLIIGILLNMINQVEYEKRQEKAREEYEKAKEEEEEQWREIEEYLNSIYF